MYSTPDAYPRICTRNTQTRSMLGYTYKYALVSRISIRMSENARRGVSIAIPFWNSNNRQKNSFSVTVCFSRCRIYTFKLSKFWQIYEQSRLARHLPRKGKKKIWIQRNRHVSWHFCGEYSFIVTATVSFFVECFVFIVHRKNRARDPVRWSFQRDVAWEFYTVWSDLSNKIKLTDRFRR